MWIMTEYGFFSVVQKPWDVQTLTVRARAKFDLEALRKNLNSKHVGQIIHDDKADYPYRMQVGRHALGEMFSEDVRGIRYANFKGKIATTNPRRAKTYEKVWLELHELEKE